ncbi:MAG TPA: hypothetical protein VGP22_10280 [Albitalea sp.]|jgi:hypothetical protein|nr:hypothetical protein [Albitalea sp.]
MKQSTWRRLGLALIAAALLTTLVVIGVVSSFDAQPLQVVIDGDEVFQGDLGALGAGPTALLVVGLLAALCVVLVVVPLALLVGGAAVVLSLLLGLGVSLLVIVLVPALLLSPLLLPIALVLWLRRRPGSATAPRAANIGA